MTFDKIKIISVSTQYQTYKTNICLESTLTIKPTHTTKSTHTTKPTLTTKPTHTTNGSSSKWFNELYEWFNGELYCKLWSRHRRGADIYIFNKLPFTLTSIDMDCGKIKGIDLDEYTDKPILKIKKFTAKLQFCKISRFCLFKGREFGQFNETEGYAYFSLSNYGKYVLYKFNPTMKTFVIKHLTHGWDIKDLIGTDFRLEHYLKFDYWKIMFENVKMPEKYRQQYLDNRKPRMTFNQLPGDILLKIIDMVDYSGQNLDVMPLINKKMFSLMHTIDCVGFGCVKSWHKDHYNQLNKYQISYFLSLDKDDERCKLMAKHFCWINKTVYDDKFMFLLDYHEFDFKENTHMIVNAQLKKGITTHFDKLKAVDEKTSALAIDNGITSHLDKFPITEQIALYAIKKGHSSKIIATLDKIDSSWRIFFSLCKTVPELFIQYSYKYEKLIIDKHWGSYDKEVYFIEFLLCSKTIDIIGPKLYSPFIIKTAKKYFIAEKFKQVGQSFQKIT